MCRCMKQAVHAAIGPGCEVDCAPHKVARRSRPVGLASPMEATVGLCYKLQQPWCLALGRPNSTRQPDSDTSSTFRE